MRTKKAGRKVAVAAVAAAAVDEEMEGDNKMRKGHEQHMQAMAESATALADAMEGKVEGLGDMRTSVEASALQAIREIDDFFRDVIAQHKQALTNAVETARKGAHQPIGDAVNTRRALERVVRTNSGAAVATEHVALALVLGQAATKGGKGGKAGRRVLVEFVVPGGGSVRDALARWKGACGVQVDAKWKARANVTPRALPSLTSARFRHAAVVTTPSNHVFVVGGHGARGDLNTVERLGSDADSAWAKESALALTTARQDCGACAVGTALVVVGGKVASGQRLASVEAVDTVSGVHTTLPSLPFGVSGCAAVSVKGKVIVTGGGSGFGGADAWALEVGSDLSLLPQQQKAPAWVRLPQLTHSREFHGAAAGGGSIFVCGGSHNGQPTDSCEKLEEANAVAVPDSATAVRLGLGLVLGAGVGSVPPRGWEPLPAMPKKLRDIGCCYGGGNVFVVGGNPNAQRSVFALNVKAEEWVHVGKLAVGRVGCAAVCVGRRVMVLGGYNFVKPRGCEVLAF